MNSVNLKKRMLLALCTAFAVACLALAGCGASSSAASDDAGEYKLIEQGKIIVGSDLDYKPMEYRDGDTATGFGVAMMYEIADRLGLECEFLPPQNFDTLITQVASATKMDIAVSSIHRRAAGHLWRGLGEGEPARCRGCALHGHHRGHGFASHR